MNQAFVYFCGHRYHRDIIMAHILRWSGIINNNKQSEKSHCFFGMGFNIHTQGSTGHLQSEKSDSFYSGFHVLGDIIWKRRRENAKLCDTKYKDHSKIFIFKVFFYVNTCFTFYHHPPI